MHFGTAVIRDDLLVKGFSSMWHQPRHFTDFSINVCITLEFVGDTEYDDVL